MSSAASQLRTRLSRALPPEVPLDFVLYLAAVALLPVRFLSPFGALSEEAILSDLILAGAAGLWWVRAIREGRRLRPNAIHGLFLAFLALVAMSALFALDRRTGVQHAVVAAELVVLAVLTWDYAGDPARRMRILQAVAAAAVLAIVGAVAGEAWFYATGDTNALTSWYGEVPESSSYVRIAGGFGSSPLLGSFTIVAAALLLGLAGDGVIDRRPAIVLGVVLGIVCALTISRPLIGFLAMLAALYGLGSRTPAAAKVAAVVVIVGCCGAMAVLAAGSLQLDLENPPQTRLVIPSDKQPRADQIASAWSEVDERPLVGHGPGALVSSTDKYPNVVLRVHLTPLNIAVTTGIPALLVLISLLVVLWRRRARSERWTFVVWCALLGIAVDSLGQDVEHFRHVWLLIGLAAAATSMRPVEPPRSCAGGAGESRPGAARRLRPTARRR